MAELGNWSGSAEREKQFAFCFSSNNVSSMGNNCSEEGNRTKDKIPDLDSIQKRGIWKCVDTSKPELPARLSLVKSWLPKCEERPLPTRVIDVRKSVSYIPPENSKDRYAALSYCWGPNPRDFKTKRSILEDRTQSLVLPNEYVPKTISDAIEITKALEIPYLWIEALCIIQGDDNTAEFEAEAAQMADVYQGAAVTIAATASNNNDGGCSLRDVPQGHFLSLPSSRRRFFRSQPVYAFSEDLCLTLEKLIDGSPLNKRGWTLQEAVLSPRIIHFSNSQVIWEDEEKLATEDGMLIWKKDGVRRPFSNLAAQSTRVSDDLYQEWSMIVVDYTMRELKQVEDRYRAIAGVTKSFQARLNDEPLLGLWRHDLALSLLWAAKHPGRRVNNSKLPNVPSWSWISVCSEVHYPAGRPRSRSEGDDTVEAANTDAVVTWQGTYLTSNIEKAVLELKDIVRPVNDLKQTSGLKCWIDVTGSSEADATHCLLVCRVSTIKHLDPLARDVRSSTAKTKTTDWFLLLKAAGVDRCYSRVGVGSVKDNSFFPRGQAKEYILFK